MLKRLLSLVVILLILPVAYANDEVIKNPAGIEQITVDILQSGSVLMEGQPTKAIINLTIPQDDYRQDVEIDIKKLNDQFGNTIGLIESGNPGNTVEYAVRSKVRSRSVHTEYLPSSYSIPDDIKVYLEPTPNIQSENKEIKELAEEITKNAKDGFDKVAKLAMWVNENLKYDISYSDRVCDALTVLRERRGVCSEYTTLFMALSRSTGIPSRYVSAYARGKGGWERHAYAEVWLGKWVPVDTLWLEIGYIDATHIRFGSYKDNQIQNKIEVLGYNVKNVQWIKDKTDINITEFKSRPEEENYQLIKTSDSLYKGDYAIIIMEFEPNEYMVAEADLEPCSGGYRIASIENKSEKIVLRPREKEIIYWIVHVDDGLPEGYVFNCPLTLNSRSFVVKSVNLTVDTSHKIEKSSLSAIISSSVIKYGDEQTVYIDVGNVRKKISVGAIAGNKRREWFVDKDSELVFKFIPKTTGSDFVIVYTSDGNVLKIPYTVKSEFNVSIENMSVPCFLKVDTDSEISAIIKSNTGRLSLRAKWNIGGKEAIDNVLVENKYEIKRLVRFDSVGSKIVSLAIDGPGINVSRTKMIEVYDIPRISVIGLYADKKGVLSLNVSNYKAKNVTILLSGQEKNIDEIYGEKIMYFNVNKGTHLVKISYEDVSGKRYETRYMVDFKEKDILGVISDFIKLLIAKITKFMDNIITFVRS